MSGKSLQETIETVGADGRVTAEEVLFLRRNVFADGVVSRQEIESLFALARRAPDGDQEWPDYFAEAASDFFLREEEPQGYLTDAEFSVLKSFVGGAGATPIALGLMIRLLENAVSTPRAMTDFVAENLRMMIENAPGGPRVSAADAALIRRYLFAAGGDGSIAVTRDEAELLFDINDISAGATNDPAWVDLFIKGVANHLMAHIGYQPPSREEALRLHAWAEDSSTDLSGFFSRMFSGGLSSIRDAYGSKSLRSRKNADDEIAAAIAEQVTAREADWLADRIGRDGTVHETEKALIAYMRELEADLPPRLQALIDAAA